MDKVYAIFQGYVSELMENERWFVAAFRTKDQAIAWAEKKYGTEYNPDSEYYITKFNVGEYEYCYYEIKEIKLGEEIGP